MKKKEKRDLFIKLTRKESWREIIKRQKETGEILSKQERHAIIQEKANEAKRKVKTIAFASMFGIVAFGVGFGAGRLTAGNNEKSDIPFEESDSKDDFRGGLIVDVPERKPETSRIETIKKELDGSDSTKLLEYWKDLYIQSYKESTGEDLNVEDIDVKLSNQNYIYVLDNGQMVTHGNYPAETEKLLDEDERIYDAKYNVDIYQVTYKDQKIDAMAKGGQQVIPGDRYDELKDGKSGLTNIGEDITNLLFELRELSTKLSEDPENEYVQLQYEKTKSKLAEAIVTYENRDVSQDKAIIDEEPEL